MIRSLLRCRRAWTFRLKHQTMSCATLRWSSSAAFRSGSCPLLAVIACSSSVVGHSTPYAAFAVLHCLLLASQHGRCRRFPSRRFRTSWRPATLSSQMTMKRMAWWHRACCLMYTRPTGRLWRARVSHSFYGSNRCGFRGFKPFFCSGAECGRGLTCLNDLLLCRSYTATFLMSSWLSWGLAWAFQPVRQPPTVRSSWRQRLR